MTPPWSRKHWAIFVAVYLPLLLWSKLLVVSIVHVFFFVFLRPRPCGLFVLSPIHVFVVLFFLSLFLKYKATSLSPIITTIL